MKTFRNRASAIAALLVGGMVLFGTAESSAQGYYIRPGEYSNGMYRIPGTTVWVTANAYRVGNLWVEPNYYWNNGVVWPNRGFVAPVVPSTRARFLNNGFTQGTFGFNTTVNSIVNPGFITPSFNNTVFNSGF